MPLGASGHRYMSQDAEMFMIGLGMQWAERAIQLAAGTCSYKDMKATEYRTHREFNNGGRQGVRDGGRTH